MKTFDHADGIPASSGPPDRAAAAMTLVGIWRAHARIARDIERRIDRRLAVEPADIPGLSEAGAERHAEIVELAADAEGDRLAALLLRRGFRDPETRALLGDARRGLAWARSFREADTVMRRPALRHQSRAGSVPDATLLDFVGDLVGPAERRSRGIPTGRASRDAVIGFGFEQASARHRAGRPSAAYQSLVAERIGTAVPASPFGTLLTAFVVAFGAIAPSVEALVPHA